MPNAEDLPPAGARMIDAALSRARPAEEGMLRDLDLEWTGRRGVLARLGLARAAQDPQRTPAGLSKCLVGGLRAYRAAHAAALATSRASPPSWSASLGSWSTSISGAW